MWANNDPFFAIEIAVLIALCGTKGGEPVRSMVIRAFNGEHDASNVTTSFERIAAISEFAWYKFIDSSAKAEVETVRSIMEDIDAKRSPEGASVLDTSDFYIQVRNLIAALVCIFEYTV